MNESIFCMEIKHPALAEEQIVKVYGMSIWMNLFS